MLYLIAACTVLSANALQSPLHVRRSSSALHAGGGPPQYDKIDATLVANEVVGRATASMQRTARAPPAASTQRARKADVERWLQRIGLEHSARCY